MKIIAAVAISAAVIQWVCWKIDSPIYLLYAARSNLIVSLTLVGCGIFIGVVSMWEWRR